MLTRPWQSTAALAAPTLVPLRRRRRRPHPYTALTDDICSVAAAAAHALPGQGWSLPMHPDHAELAAQEQARREAARESRGGRLILRSRHSRAARLWQFCVGPHGALSASSTVQPAASSHRPLLPLQGKEIGFDQEDAPGLAVASTAIFQGSACCLRLLHAHRRVHSPDAAVRASRPSSRLEAAQRLLKRQSLPSPRLPPSGAASFIASLNDYFLTRRGCCITAACRGPARRFSSFRLGQ